MIFGLVVYDAQLLRVCAHLDQGLRVSRVTWVVNNMSTYGGVHVLHLRLHSHVDGCEQMADKEVGRMKPNLFGSTHRLHLLKLCGCHNGSVCDLLH